MSTIKNMACQLGMIIEEAIVPPNGKNVPGLKLSHWYTITVHETGNRSKDADARFHNRYVQGGGGKGGVSYTFVVDQDRAIQNLPLDAVNYAQGTMEGNHTSVSVETCINAGADWTRTLDNLAKLVAVLCKAGGLTVDQVVQHNRWYGKNCPETIRATPGGWDALLAKVADYLADLKV